MKSESEVAQSCDPMDCSLPGSSVHGIFQARVLEWGAIAFSIYLLASTFRDILSFYLLLLFLVRGHSVLFLCLIILLLKTGYFSYYIVSTLGSDVPS